MASIEVRYKLTIFVGMAELQLLHTIIRAHEVCVHKQLWPQAEMIEGLKVHSNIRTAMAFQTIRYAKQYLELYESVDPADYFHVTTASWTQLFYVLIMLNRIIFLDSDPIKQSSSLPQPATHIDRESSWDPALAATEAEIHRFGNSLRTKLGGVTINLQCNDKRRNAMYNFGFFVHTLTRYIDNIDQAKTANSNLQASPSTQTPAVSNLTSTVTGSTARSFSTPATGDAIDSPFDCTGMDLNQGLAGWPGEEQLDMAWNTMMQDLTMMPLPWFDQNGSF